MTCIIGLVEDGVVYMGGDSAVSNYYEIRTLAAPKVFRLGPFLIGGCGDVRLVNILRHHIAVPERQPGVSDESYIVCSFVEAIRAKAKELGHTEIDKSREQVGGSYLVAYRQMLYEVSCDFSVTTLADPLYACGSGAQYALGAMAALERLKPRKRIKAALEIAARFCPTVAAPFYVEMLDAVQP